MKKIAVSVFLSLIFGSFSISQDKIAIKYSNDISIDSLYSHISILASDSLEGRAIGEKGHDIAANYIRNKLVNSGAVCPSGGSNFQELKVVKSYWDEVYVEHGNKRYRNLKDGVVFLGDKAFAQEKSFSALLVSNAINKNETDQHAMVYFNNPYWLSFRRKQPEPEVMPISFIIDNNNPKAFDSIASRMKRSFYLPRYSFPNKSKPEEGLTSVVFVSEKVASEIFGIKKERLRRMSMYSEIEKTRNFPVFKPVELNVKAVKNFDTLAIHNVLGYIEGTDLKDEVLVISAHYDHLGVNGDQIYNGADDNASGVAAMLEISRIFNQAIKDGHNPRRSILFIAFTGEERGLFGSRYYADHPSIPLENTIANLNIDMIGRVDDKYADNPDYVYLIGSDKISMDLHNLSEHVNRTYTQLELDYTYNADDDPNRFYFRSDHYNFAKNNIPVIFYFNGTHDDYHEPTDTIEKIDFETLKKRAQLIFHTAWKLVNADSRPSINVNQ